MTRFGQIISADQLEDDLTTYLKKWFAAYSAEVSEQRGGLRGDYSAPKYWTTTPILTVDAVTQVRYPAVLIVSPGLVSQPSRHGDGSYEATYQIGVCILVTADSEMSAGRLARRYGAAVHTAVMQRPSLDTNYIEEVAWSDERFTDYLNANQDTVSSVTEIFSITIKNVFNSYAGPGPAYPNPLPEPAVAPATIYANLPTVGDPNGGSPYLPVPAIIKVP